MRLALQSLGARRDLGVLIESGEAPAGAEPIRQDEREFEDRRCDSHAFPHVAGILRLSFAGREGA